MEVIFYLECTSNIKTNCVQYSKLGARFTRFMGSNPRDDIIFKCFSASRVSTELEIQHTVGFNVNFEHDFRYTLLREM